MRWVTENFVHDVTLRGATDQCPIVQYNEFDVSRRIFRTRHRTDVTPSYIPPFFAALGVPRVPQKNTSEAEAAHWPEMHPPKPPGISDGQRIFSQIDILLRPTTSPPPCEHMLFEMAASKMATSLGCCPRIELAVLAMFSESVNRLAKTTWKKQVFREKAKWPSCRGGRGFRRAGDGQGVL